MDLVAQLKTMLTESAGEEVAIKVVESLDKIKTQLTTEAKVAAEAGVAQRITEAVNAKEIELEAGYLKKVDTIKAELTEQTKVETGTFETQLAARTKTVLEQGLKEHGDRLATIEEAHAVKAGSTLLEQIEAVVGKAKTEITESNKADPTEIVALKAKLTEAETKLKDAEKKLLGERARGNVAEKNLKELRESLEQSVTVTVEAGDTKSKPAGEVENAAITESANGGNDAGKKFSPEMERMRKAAGIKPVAAKK